MPDPTPRPLSVAERVFLPLHSVQIVQMTTECLEVHADRFGHTRSDRDCAHDLMRAFATVRAERERAERLRALVAFAASALESGELHAAVELRRALAEDGGADA